MGLKFEEDTLETLVTAIKGTDRVSFTLYVLMIWIFLYAAVSLYTDNLFTAILSGLLISIFGICSLFNVLLEFIRYSLFRTSFQQGNIRKSAIIFVLSVLILLDLKGLITPGSVLEPLDLITNYLFFIILIIPLSEGALDIITINDKPDMQNFIKTKFDSDSIKKLTYIISTMLFISVSAGIYLAVSPIRAALFNNAILVLVCIIVPGLMYSIADRLHKYLNLVDLMELLLHLGAAGVLVGFLYRAWLIHSKLENGETMEIFTIGIVVISGVIYSANRIKRMKFSSPRIISEYLFGMCALGLGGVVFAILFNLNTATGFLTMDVAMTYFYVVQSLAIAIALLISSGRKAAARFG